MKERPILFNSEMINALLNGPKTETRRVIKPQPNEDVIKHFSNYEYRNIKDNIWKGFSDKQGFVPTIKCPFGKVGDQLWVRETYLKKGNEFHSYVADYDDNMFKSTEPMGKALKAKMYKRIPSIYMFRKYSRIQLEITEIKVEGVQDITEDGARNEGIHSEHDGTHSWFKNYNLKEEQAMFKYPSGAIKSFKSLWNSINEKRGYSFESNPWVWAVKFKVVKR